MRIPLLRTLSGRIILGFAVLIITFGTISALIVFNTSLLGREIRLIRTVYLPLALEASNLSEKQKSLWEYLSNDLASESSVRRARGWTRRHKVGRDQLLAGIEEIIRSFDGLPQAHRTYLQPAIATVSQIRARVRAQEKRYQSIIETPPIEQMAELVGHHATYERSLAAFKQLKVEESGVHKLTERLARDQRNKIKNIAQTLERDERQLRLFSLFMGMLALLVGLLITAWATLTLRPLKRLRDAAKRIAHGDYASRIGEQGPVEVADLAREFNTMGGAIEERERELVRSARLVAVGEMAAKVTHEIRNPLSSIGLNTELLEEELGGLDAAATEEARALCRAITAEVDRLAGITQEYLQFARLPKPKLRPERVDAIVSSLAEFERESLALRGVALGCELAPDLPRVMADHAQIRQALLNLVRNAADAVEAAGGGAVTLVTRPAEGPGRGVELCVIDDGPGIDEAIADRLFEPFVSTKDGGTGLGLALTREIIREHGGQLAVDSRPGAGATFAITLPAADDGGPAATR